ncbi:MAG: HAD hydrolase-like protein [Betaproteobacteria bacterium]|nr:HAD hydrolase-like protein [Betaproteobacteria bacterium]
MDGVITDTTPLHTHAWKQTLDALLATLPDRGNLSRPFDPVADYYRYIDGRVRTEGLRSFLASRKLEIPIGETTDKSYSTIHGIAYIKNSLYQELLILRGVSVHTDAVSFIDTIRRAGLKLGLATSSRNAWRILEMTKLHTTFDVVVDGNDIENLGLHSKPASDIFVYAAKQLGFALEHCAVFEDSFETLERILALSPGCAIGVFRNGNPAVSKELYGINIVPNLTDAVKPFSYGMI